MVMVVVTAKEYKGRGWRSGWGGRHKKFITMEEAY